MSTGTKLLLAVLAALALCLGSYRFGVRNTDNAWQAKLAKERDAAAAKVRKAEAQADATAGAYVREHFDQEARYAELDDRNRQLARTTGLFAPGLAGAQAQSPACTTSSTTSSTTSTTANATPASAAAPADPELSLRAVWVWNSALAGADMPASVCGLAGGAAGAGDAAACAQGSGVTAEDAWANHAINARSCTADRARYSALIKALAAQQGPRP